MRPGLSSTTCPTRRELHDSALCCILYKVCRADVGAMAQLVAHLHGMERVRGSNPLSSTDKGFRVIGSLFRIQPLVDHPTDAIARKPNKTAACIPASGRNHQISRGVAPRIATSCGPRSAWPARHESAAAAGRSALRQTALQRPFPRLPSARQAWSWQAALRSCRGTC